VGERVHGDFPLVNAAEIYRQPIRPLGTQKLTLVSLQVFKKHEIYMRPR
jgi:hypothetical protein